MTTFNNHLYLYVKMLIKIYLVFFLCITVYLCFERSYGEE